MAKTESEETSTPIQDYFTRALTGAATEWEPELTQALLPDLVKNYSDLLNAIKQVHVDQTN